MVARMDVPGRWAGGFRLGRARRVPRDRPRAPAGRVLQVPAEVLRERSDAWFRSAATSSRASTTARSIESTARQRESLVTLGTLAAGLAHELNNPASAATRRSTPSRRRAPPWSRPWAGSPARSSRPGGWPRSTPCATSSRPGRRTRTRWPAPTASRRWRRG